jgi:uncharacterized caspase-like protein
LRKFFAFLWIGCASACLCSGAAGETRALLIGVSGYPSLPRHMQLHGPANDVRLMRTALARQGVAERNIEILADGLHGTALPTRQNILQRIANLRQLSSPGDWAILYFSGHGSQQPQKNRNISPEPDGRDEIFLPYDIGRWDGQVGSVRNAIVDDEVGELLNGFVRAGVSVWAIFDTCHAGDMSKTLPGDADLLPHWRYVPASALGVPDNGSASNGNGARRTARLGSLPDVRVKTAPLDGSAMPGKTVVFYSSRYDEPAPEEPIPAAPGKAVHGVFTWYLAKAMDKSASHSFHHILQDILRNYAGDQRAFPTPSAEGRTELALSNLGGQR